MRPRLLFIPMILVVIWSCADSKAGDGESTAVLMRSRTIGLALLEEGRLKEAGQEFQRIIELAPEEGLGHANRALIALREGEPGDAEEGFRKALERDPSNQVIILNLAEVLNQTGRADEAAELLNRALEENPTGARLLFRLGTLDVDDPAHRRKVPEILTRCVQATGGSVPPRLELVEAHLRAGQADSAVAQLEVLQRQLPELPPEAMEFFDQALRFAREGAASRALVPIKILHGFLKGMAWYEAERSYLTGSSGPLVGSPVLRFGVDLGTNPFSAEDVAETVVFTDATEQVGLSSVVADLALTVDWDNDGDEDLLVSSETGTHLLQNQTGRMEEATERLGAARRLAATAGAVGDYDNDGFLDVFLATKEGGVLLNNGGGTLFTVAEAGLRALDAATVSSLLFADLDHEGDLDLLVTGNRGVRIYRNEGDDGFFDRTEAMGLADGVETRGATSDATVGDLDGDGDLDVWLTSADGGFFVSNLRGGRFSRRLDAAAAGTAPTGLCAGDYNNDGSTDLLVWDETPGSSALLRNDGAGSFTRDPGWPGSTGPQPETVADGVFLDYDNDGFLDILITGTTTRLYRNKGAAGFEESPALPRTLESHMVALLDLERDGDQDLLFFQHDGPSARPGGRLLFMRNDGGNANHHLAVRLAALRTGSGKNNSFGVGATVEVTAGGLYQMRIARGSSLHFGLGRAPEAEVVRVLWPNGVPQNEFGLQNEVKIAEEQILKGSCAFLYAWNGTEVTLVTDILWRSALGMPLGIMGGTTQYAFADSADEHLLVRSEDLQPVDGLYTLHITEELWETAYFDHVHLVALDHPEETTVYIDERFRPPPLPPLRIHTVSEKLPPVSAVDGAGKDVLPALIARDSVYLSDLVPSRYQGLTEMHDLILDPGDLPADVSLELYLTGWIFPSDASINAALSQSGATGGIPPFLQTLDDQGRWQTVIESLSFPMGKDKTVIADLKGRYLSDDRRVRIRTNMEIYWDHAFFSPASSGPESVAAREEVIRKTVLQPEAAELRYRGFSRPYRKGGRYGPHWFDYADVSAEPKWRDLVGSYTRYGDVLPLLIASDDECVILNAGDEMLVKFSAPPPPPRGWRRDFLLYSDGWLKDGDLNTATGQTVEPLPFHGMRRYPYGSEQSYPEDERHRRYTDTYNTRTVTTRRWRELIRERT